MTVQTNNKIKKVNLDKFPGLLGYGGIIAIHADWPVYPPGIGWEVALKTLGNFPRGTNFYEIDDIDGCKLLINQNPSNLSEPFDRKYYHSAVWHEDLIELKRRDLISGVLEKSDYEFRLTQFERVKIYFQGNFIEDAEGNIVFFDKDDRSQPKELMFKKPKPDDEDEDLFSNDYVVIQESTCLTEKGFEELIKLADEVKLKENLYNLTCQLIEIGRFDTAIRDASLLLETTIKEFHKRPLLFGQGLVEFHIKEIIKNNEDVNSAAIKCYRSELRTIFSFIRNDFVHNFRVLTKEQCKMIISRINDSLQEFEEIATVYFKKNNT